MQWYNLICFMLIAAGLFALFDIRLNDILSALTGGKQSR